MRIAFLCGGLEPGRDGVGDYAQALAGECVRQGHACSVLALNDRQVGITPSGASIPTGAIPHLRLSASLLWDTRIKQAETFLRDYQPDWISLEFVPYGFHDKGLVRGLGKHLARLIEGRRLHLMFHELWIGAYAGASLKHRMVGFVQRQLILGLVGQLQPAFVSTSNFAYIGMLKRGGVAASHLPLFGNIPLIDDADESWLFTACSEAGLRVTPTTRREFLIFGLFGTLHPSWPPEPLLTLLRTAAANEGKRVIIASIGRIGSGEQLWEQVTRSRDRVIDFVTLGEQSARRVSEFLQWIDFGVAASPWELIGKSGSVASMLEHGLPVIVNRDDVCFGNVTDTEVKDPLLVKMDAQLPARLRELRKGGRLSRLPATAEKFLRLLEPTGGSDPAAQNFQSAT